MNGEALEGGGGLGESVLAPDAVAAAPLLERESELERLRAALDDVARGEGRMLLLTGEAGIGKTTLLGRLTQIAAERGLRVLGATGSDLERDFGWGAARQLYEPVLREAGPKGRRQLLQGAAELAAPMLGFATPVGPPGFDATFAVNHGLYWLTANLAAERPVVISIDDAHWADAATLLFLNYLGRRLEGMPVLLVAALRPHEPGAPRELLDPLADLAAAERIVPSPLSEAAAGSLIERLLGEAADERFRQACHRATGGNPFLLEELLRALARDGVRPTLDAVGRVRRLGPNSIARGVIGRLATMWPEALKLACAVAILGDDAELRHAAALADIGQAAAAEAADTLVAAKVLAPGRPVRFLHPVLRRAVYGDIAASRRAAQHARAARLLDGDGVDVHRVAAQLLPSEPAGDPWVVERLRTAASRSLASGATASAIVLLERALREPPAPEERCTLLLELGTAESLAQRSEALVHLGEALQLADRPADVSAAAIALGQTLEARGDLEGAFDLAGHVLGRLGDDPSALALEGFWLAAAQPAGRAAETISRAEELARRLRSDSPAACAVLGQTAMLELMAARPAGEVRQLARRALWQGALPVGDATTLTGVAPGLALMWTDDLDGADRLFSSAITAAQRMGSRRDFIFYSAVRGFSRQLAGDLVRAEADLEEALSEEHFGFAQLIASIAKVRLLVDRGEYEEAERLAAAAPVPAALERQPVVAMLRHAHGRVQLAQGRFELAARTIERVGEVLRETALQSPPMIFSWRSDLALARARAESGDQALRLAQQELDLAERCDVDRARGVALRAMGLIEGGDAGLARLERAAALLERSPGRLEYAWALVELGSALRRANQRSEARDPLSQALDLAHRCGSRRLAERAHQELRACGARPRRLVLAGVDSLTASERRVARMAAEGMSNPEIAQALFVTRKTVETHLGRVFRKLGVSSREELGGALERQRAVA